MMSSRRLGTMGAAGLALVTGLAALGGCGTDEPAAPAPSASTARVVFAYLASTRPRTDLTPSQQACARGVGQTHIHPSWRSFNRIDFRAVGAERWEIAFDDVPVNTRLSIRVSDGNACDENATGAATRNVLANDVRLVEIVPTPGSGIEPGLAFTVAPGGRVSP